MFRRLRLTGLVAALVIALALSACTPKSVAMVNGEAVGKKQFDARVADVQAQYAAYGIEVTDETLAAIQQDVLEQMIDELLLVQGAKQAGIVVSTEEVDAYYAEMASGYEDEAAFLTAAEENGYTKASLRAEIAQYLLIANYQEQHIEASVDLDTIAVTDAEMRDLYASYAEQIPDIPPYDEVAIYLEQELRDQKIADLGIIESLLVDLRAAAKIEKSL